MSGETEGDVSGWTVDTLHAHYVWVISELKNHYDSRLTEMDLRNQQRFDAQKEALLEARVTAEKAVQSALAAADKAAAKSEADNLRWRNTTDEWRRSLTDITQRNINRDEFERAVSNLETTISAAIVTRQQVTDDLRVQINTVATSLRDYMPRDQSEGAHRSLETLIGAVGDRVKLGEGRTIGLNKGWGYLLGALGALVGLAGVLVAILH